MRQFVKRVTLAGFVVVAVAALAGLVLFPTPRFPKPSGPYAVGTRIYSAWTDVARPEPFTADRDDRRQLVVQIWYPTQAAGPAQRYIDRETLAVLAARLHVPALLMRNVQRAPTHAASDVAVAAGRFPVLLNPTGFSAYRDASLFWIEELASHGYVVVGMDQPGTAAATTLADGRVVPAMDIADFKRYCRLRCRRLPSRCRT